MLLFSQSAAAIIDVHVRFGPEEKTHDHHGYQQYFLVAEHTLFMMLSGKFSFALLAS